MNQVTKTAPAPTRQSSLLAIMATKYHMDPQMFASTVRKTAMPANATNEEFGAFMMVAHEYGLNPILKEIHAFPKKGGGIQPVVSVDGWLSLINRHPQLDGYSFEWTSTKDGDPISCKCIMHRKDRKHPVVVEEFLAECIRQTEPWKMKHRMLRHRALIQAARYCFGFSGIMDEDEADRIAAMRDITPVERPQRDEFEASPAATTTEMVDEATGEITDVETAEATGPDPATAYQDGIKAREENRARRSPPEWDQNANAEPLKAAWLEGWNDTDAEMAQAAKAATK